MKMVMETIMGYKRMPQGVKLRRRPIRVTTTRLMTKLRTTRSILPRLLFLVNSDAISVYPGKKSTNGKPRMMRRMLEGNRVIIRTRKIVRWNISISSLPSFNFIPLSSSYGINSCFNKYISSCTSTRSGFSQSNLV